MTRVTVGMDESAGAAEALRWAVAEATDRSWQIRAVLAWTYLDQHRMPADDTFDPGYDEKAAHQLLIAAAEGSRARGRRGHRARGGLRPGSLGAHRQVRRRRPAGGRQPWPVRVQEPPRRLGQ